MASESLCSSSDDDCTSLFSFPEEKCASNRQAALMSSFPFCTLFFSAFPTSERKQCQGRRNNLDVVGIHISQVRESILWESGELYSLVYILYIYLQIEEKEMFGWFCGENKILSIRRRGTFTFISLLCNVMDSLAV